MLPPRRSCADHTDEYGNDHGDVRNDDDAGKGGRERATSPIEAGVVPSETLEKAPTAVHQMEEERQVADDVEERHPPARQAGVHVAIRVAPHEPGVEPAPAQIAEVDEEEQQDEHAR